MFIFLTVSPIKHRSSTAYFFYFPASVFLLWNSLRKTKPVLTMRKLISILHSV